jgi:hypothetical protein
MIKENMEPKRKITKTKGCIFSLVALALLFILIELIFSVFFFHKYSDERLASLEAVKMVRGMLKKKPNPINVPNQQMVRPDSSLAANQGIAEETHASNKFQYEPWIEFRNIDFQGSYVNVSNSVRKSIPAEFINSASGDTIDIYFLGGSTTFGFNVADAETIPSQIVKLYREKYPNGKSLRVFNMGIPVYYSYQELIHFSNMVFRGHRPDIVVFLDGVNDFWFAKASYYSQSYFSYILRQVFTQDLLTYGKFNFKDTSDIMWKNPANIPLNEFHDVLISNYVRSIRNAAMMGNMVGTKTFFFCQPVPFYNYPRQQADPICFKDTNTRYDYIYPAIEKMKDSLPNFTFLANMLQNETQQPFVDGLHYSPAFNRKIAGEMLKVIEAGF